MDTFGVKSSTGGPVIERPLSGAFNSLSGRVDDLSNLADRLIERLQHVTTPVPEQPSEPRRDAPPSPPMSALQYQCKVMHERLSEVCRKLECLAHAIEQ